MCENKNPKDFIPTKKDLSELKPITLKLVNTQNMKNEWNRLMKIYHYLGYKAIIGPRLKYLAYAKDKKIIAALGWKAGSLHLETRDCFIGWSAVQRNEFLKHIINNTRFLILPWVRVDNLASYILSRNMKMVAADWQNTYGNPVYLLETFVDSAQFKGICYKAANWINVGRTKGYTRIGKQYKYHGKQKEVYIYVVEPKFREIIKCKQRPLPRRSTIPGRRRKKLMVLQTLFLNPCLLNWNNVEETVPEKITEELELFHKIFSPCFYRIDQNIKGTYYLHGLLSNIERKNVEKIALHYLDTSDVRNLQRFITDSPWDDSRMANILQEKVFELIGSPHGMITIDPSDFPKKGKESVGVARQYCGNTGKRDNCQSGVFIGYTSDKGYGLLDKQLYLPKCWFGEDYAERKDKCKVPEDIVFKTKNQIALDCVEKLIQNHEFPICWVGCDAAFGNDYVFLDTLAAKGFKYFASIKSDTLIWEQKPELMIKEYKGIGRPPTNYQLVDNSLKPTTVAELAQKKKADFKETILAEGAKGPIFAEVCICRVTEHRNGLPGKEKWIVIRRNPSGEIKYYISNAPANISTSDLIKAATMRWPIEQCFEDGKKYFGMDQYEHRSWIAWHRHMTYVFLAIHFLLRLRLKLKKKIPVLTLPQALILIQAILKNPVFDLRTACNRVRYYAIRNFNAYRSHKKKKEAELQEYFYAA